jgi:hypothetical protein
MQRFEQPVAYEALPEPLKGRGLHCGCGMSWFMVCLSPTGEIVVQLRQRHHGSWHYYQASLDDFVAEIRQTAARIN